MNRDSPSIIIYDVEKGIKDIEIKNDLVSKNFNFDTQDEEDDFKNNQVIIRHNFSTKDNLTNWIIQLSGEQTLQLLRKRRVFKLESLQAKRVH